MSDPFDPQLRSDDDGFDDLAALRAIGRDLSADDLGWDAPPDDLWARIEAEAFGVAAAPVIEPPATEPPVAEPPVVGVGGGSGRAELVNADGVKQIRLETADLDAGDGFLEVWVIDPSVTKLVSLGPLRPDGIYDLPEGLDPAQFPIVDISVEPVDGDPTHSGNSVLRGQLTV